MSPEPTAYLAQLYAGGGEYVSRSLASWKQGIQYEVDFWTRWFETKGLEWPQDYERRLAPLPLAPWLEALLPADRDVTEMLDVGAGPLTRIATFSPTREIRVTATDPLAGHYDAVIDASGIEPQVRTQLAFAEDLSARFERNRFALVTCTNALDHAIEPVWGILEMMMVLERHGSIVLVHHQNEAEFENYSGFHQ